MWVSFLLCKKLLHPYPYIHSFPPFLFLLCLIFSQQTFPQQRRGMFSVKLRPLLSPGFGFQDGSRPTRPNTAGQNKGGGMRGIFSAGLLQSDDTCSCFPLGRIKRQHNRKHLHFDVIYTPLGAAHVFSVDPQQLK